MWVYFEDWNISDDFNYELLEINNIEGNIRKNKNKNDKENKNLYCYIYKEHGHSTK